MGGFISTTLTLAYPVYASFKAIESKGKDDDTQWLTFWVVFGLFAIAESFADILLSWFPLYPTAKVLFLIALQFPGLNLAATLYNTFIKPFFTKHEGVVDAAGREAIEIAKRTQQNIAHNQ